MSKSDRSAKPIHQEQQKKSATQSIAINSPKIAGPCNFLEIKSFQLKNEEKSLQAIEHVMRVNNEWPVKIVITGWSPQTESITKK